MIESRLGELFALLTAVFWTATALSFESASKKVGSLPVNIIRLFFGLTLVSIFSGISRGMLLPLDASLHSWIWLSASGFAGLAIGDLFLLKAFVIIGSRIAMLIMALAPPMTAIIGWIFMKETLSINDCVGMLITISGIALVVLQRNPEKNGVKFSYPLKGILFAFGGALGQAVGLVLSKYGMGKYDAFASTQIREIAGIVGFSIFLFARKEWYRVGNSFKNKSAMLHISLGSFFGPFLGISFSLLSLQHTSAGVSATIMSIVPVLVIPPSIILFKEKVNFKEIVGAVIAISGVALLFLVD